MGNAIIIPENLMALSASSVLGGSEASSSMALMNMANESPSSFWRSTSCAPIKSYFYGLMDRSFSFNSVGIVAHNLYRGDQYRICTDVPTPTHGYTAYNPKTPTIASITSNTGSGYGDVDNGETSPGTTWATPTNRTIAWSLGVGFDTPGAAPVTGADKQAFWVYVRGVGTSSTTTPVVTCKLYESGTLKATLGSRTINSTTGQWMCFPWNASSLGASDGSNVECYVGITGLGTLVSYGEIGSIVWAEDHLTRTDDSGWLTYSPFSGSGITYKPQTVDQVKNILYSYGSTISGVNAVHVQIRSSKSPTDYDSGNEILPTPSNYVQVGCLVVGEKWSPSVNFGYGKLVGGVDTSPKKRTYGGQLFGSRRPVRRVIALKLGHLTPAECHTLFDRMIWRHGVMKPFLISLLPDDATQSKHTTVFAALRNPENWINIQPDEGYENNLELEFEEVM